MIPNNDAAKQFLEARIAIRSATNPLAFLRLGRLYAQGIGTTPNHVLANYFYDKAASMGCEDAFRYIIKEYESGVRDLSRDIEKELDSSGTLSPEKAKRFGKIIERIRSKKYYGLLSQIHEHLHLFYPDYSPSRAINDIIKGRDSIDADIFYSLSTSDNQSEIDLDAQEILLQQLYSPITKNKDLFRQIKRANDTDILGTEACELLQAIVNYTYSYYNICKAYDIKKKEIMSIDSMELFPYIDVSTLALLRRQIVRCLLSIKDIHPLINVKFLNCLDSDEQLLNVCEEFDERKDKDIQLFLISFVELNIDIESLETTYLTLLASYRRSDYEPLSTYLNEFVERLTEAGFEHQLPVFTSDNLPTFELAI